MFQDFEQWTRLFSKSADSFDQLSSSSSNQKKHAWLQNASLQTKKRETGIRTVGTNQSYNRRDSERTHFTRTDRVYNGNITPEVVLHFGSKHRRKVTRTSKTSVSNQSSSNDNVDVLGTTTTSLTIFRTKSEISFQTLDARKRVNLSFDYLACGLGTATGAFTKPRSLPEAKLEHSLSSLPPDYSLLPKSLLTRIFCFLDINDLMSCSLVCKQWNSAEKDDAIWKHLCETCRGTLKDRMEAVLGQLEHCRNSKSFKRRYVMLAKRRKSVATLSKPAVQKFTFSELERNGVFVETKIPTFSRSAVTFWFIDTFPGEFILIIQYGRVPMELKYKVTELIEMLLNGIECIDDDIVVWSSRNLLHFLNTYNIGLHEVPSTVVDGDQAQNNTSESLESSLNNTHNNRRYSL
jgi:hypothetical protein